MGREVVSVGLALAAVGMSAKAGILAAGDLALLERRSARMADAAPELAAAVADFKRGLRSDPVAAGAALQQFAIDWRPAFARPRWMDRVDING